MKDWRTHDGQEDWNLHIDNDGATLSHHAEGSATFATSSALRDFLAGKQHEPIERVFGRAILDEARAHARELLHTTPPPAVLVSPMACSICLTIATPAYARTSDGERLPGEYEKLEQAPNARPTAFQKDHDKRCPQCWTYYSYSYSYEYLVPRSEEDESLGRLTPVQVIAALDGADRDEYVVKMREAIAVWRTSESAAVREHAESIAPLFTPDAAAR